MAKSKYIIHQCAYCHKQTKMELVGEMQNEGAVAPSQKVWFRCTRCKHSALLDAVSVQKEKNASIIKIERKECIEYSKEKVFPLGQAIYHAELDDMGKVIGRSGQTAKATCVMLLSPCWDARRYACPV